MARTSFREGSNSNTIDWAPQVDKDGAPRRNADPEKDFIEGHLLKKKTEVGKNLSNVYEIKISPDPKVPYTGFGEPGEIISLWGSKSSGSNNVLDKQMDQFITSPEGGLGAWIRIEFSGRELKKEAKDKAPGAIQASDLIILYTVIADNEIVRIEVAGAAAYVPVTNNAAPAPSAPAAAVAEVPAALSEETSEEDDLPF